MVREFSSPEFTSVLTLIGCPFLPCVTIVAHKTKRFKSFLQRCRWKVTDKHAYRLNSTSEWADYALHAGIVWEPIGEKSSHATDQETLSQLSQFAEPLWTDHGLKSRSGV